MELELNQTASVEIEVRGLDCASALSLIPDEQYPAVFATSRLVAIMEQAAARILAPHLKDGELSVGVDVNIKHIAPTGISDKVRADAKYIGLEGKLHKFEVRAFDSSGEVGYGTHTRAIIDRKRLEDKAKSKIK